MVLQIGLVGGQGQDQGQDQGQGQGQGRGQDIGAAVVAATAVTYHPQPWPRRGGIPLARRPVLLLEGMASAARPRPWAGVGAVETETGKAPPYDADD